MRRRDAIRSGVASLTALLWGGSARGAGHPERFRRTTYNRCVVPNRPYAEQDQVFGGVSAFSFPEVVADSITRLVGADRRIVRRKSFHLQAPVLQFGPFALKQVGFVVYETGEVEAGGLISHDGGPFGRLHGGQAIVRVRAFSAGNSDRPAANAAQLWSAEASRWISRGAETRMPFAIASYGELATHFDEITHIQVNLGARKDR